MNKKIALFLILISILSINITRVYAQTSVIVEAEQEREKQLSKELSLNLPETTDDPNYPITFVDPSKKGVELTIDDKITANAPSPFITPNLGIGLHTVTFKFTNKDGLIRVLSKKLIVAPKPPIFSQTIKTSVVRPSQVVISGTALPQSTVQLVVNSAKAYKFSANQEGKWEFIIPDPTEGKMNVMGFVIRDGFVSEASKVITIDYRLQESAGIITNPVSATEDQTRELFRKAYDFVQSHPQEVLISSGVILLLVVAIAAVLFIQRNKKKKDEKSIADIFKTMGPGNNILEVMKEEEKTTVSDNTPTTKSETGKNKMKSVKKEKTPKEEPPKPESDAPTKEEKKSIKQKKAPKSEEKIVNVSIEKKEVLPEASEEDSDEPAKKILSKEEFLKQFQAKNEQTDK